MAFASSDLSIGVLETENLRVRSFYGCALQSSLTQAVCTSAVRDQDLERPRFPFDMYPI